MSRKYTAGQISFQYVLNFVRLSSADPLDVPYKNGDYVPVAKIEVILRKALWDKGYRYRKNYKKLPGSPDIVLTKYKIAIFCDGEFFHGKDWDTLKLKLEKSNNSEYWIKKISRNIEHDDEINKKLDFEGWTVIRFWGKDIKKHTDECVKVVEETIFDMMINQ